MSSILDTALLDAAINSARQRWVSPHPDFTSGADKRSSDNAMLVLMYGGVCHAVRNDWENAGRSLIDKTYLDILRHVARFTAVKAVAPQMMAASLDVFLRDVVKPVWQQQGQDATMQDVVLLLSWLSHARDHLFGSLDSELLASRLFFFLFPHLPVFNWSHGHELALKELGYTIEGRDYQSYQLVAGRACKELLQGAELVLPTSDYGDTQENEWIDAMLTASDWWKRRVFDEVMLLQLNAPDNPNLMELFGCDGSGDLISG